MKLSKGCECKDISCFETFDPEAVYRHRLNIAELTKNESDFYLMGVVRASIMDFSNKGTKRQRNRSHYSYMGKKVCLFAFLYLENITIYQLKKIRNHLQNHGVTQIQHGNSHKMPHNAFSLDLYKRVETFLRNYLRTNQTQSNKSIVLNHPLSKVYQEYKNQEKDTKIMGYTTFRSFFRKQFPNVKLPNQFSKQQNTTSDKALTKDVHSMSSCQEIEVIEEHLIEEDREDEQIIYSNTDDLIYYDDAFHEEIVN